MNQAIQEQVLAFCAQQARFRAAINKHFGRQVDITNLLKQGFLTVNAVRSFHAVNMKQYRTTVAGAQWALARLQQRQQECG